MSLQVACPQCHAPFTLKDALRGKKIRCGKCQTTFLADTPREDDEEPEERDADWRPPAVRRPDDSPSARPRRRREEEDREGEEEEARPVRRRKRSQPKSRTGLVLLVLGAAGVALVVLAAAGAWLWKNHWGPGSAAGADYTGPALHLPGRTFVEVRNTRDLFDLNGTFTIEMWVRWIPRAGYYQYLAGNEAWPGMDEDFAVDRNCGWVLRLAPAEAGQRTLDFSVAAESSSKPVGDWVAVKGLPVPDVDRWQHIAVCKTPEVIRVYWNGELYASQSCQGLRFPPNPDDIFLGVRRFAYSDRIFGGSFRAFRLSSAVRYQGKFTPPAVFASEPTDLVLLDFAAGNFQQIPDRTGKGHNGVIFGGDWVGQRAASPGQAGGK